MLWTIEQSDSFNAPVGGAPAYLSPEQQVRWHRLRGARLLYEGKHRQYFLGEGRSQHDYPSQRIAGRIRQLYVTLNLLKLVSVKTADLMFGARPRIDAPTQEQTDRLDELARRSKIHARLHTAVVEASWAGGAFLESMLYRGEGYLDTIPPDEIYPLGTAGPDDQYERYVRFATANIGTTTAPLLVLLETAYEPGAIIRRLRQMDRDGKPRGELPLEQWPTWPGGIVPPNKVRTGLGDNLITYVPNEAGGRLELSDYDGLIELQDSVNAKFAQIARVLAKHADPKLAAPAAAADDTGQLPASADVYFYNSKEDIPSYIVWNAELQSGMTDRDAAIDAFCIAAEMSQVILGIKKGGTPDSARKVRLEATSSLAKVGRKAVNAEPAFARAIEVTQRLDQTSSLRRSYPVEPIGLEMRDGLPIDELDEAQVIATLRGAGVMSVEDAVERRKEDPDAAWAEVQRLKAEAAAGTPSILLGREPELPTAGPPTANLREADE